jgi:hypothetical protein
MTTDFETDLRTALAARAAEVPATALTRLAAADYRPRAARLTPVRVGVGTGVLAGAAATGAALSVVLGGAAPAYAGWSATPTAAPSAAPSPQVSQSCLSALPSNVPSGGELGSGTWQTVLTDERGPFTVALFQNDGAYASCFTSSSFTEVTQVAADDSAASNAQSVNGVVRTGGSASGSAPGGLSSVTVGGTSSGDLQNVVQTHLATTADGPYTLVEGRVASGVTGVTLVRDDGQDVVATVADGWLVAWWPGDATATSSQVTTASGTSTEPLQLSTKTPPGPPPLGPGACASAGGTTATANASNSNANAPSVPVHCAGSGSTGNSGNSGSGGSGGGPSTNTNSAG